MKRTIAILAAAAMLVVRAHAYEPDHVHRQMTEEAFRAAEAKDKFLKMLALTDKTTFGGRTAEEWAAKGGVDEDAGFPPFPRSLNHFYDPVNDIPLSIGFCPKFPFGIRAPIWGTDATLNTFDIVSAKKHYLDALTLPTPLEREQKFGLLFYSLGHVMHLIEDMAQPEHTRNDQHLYPSSLYEKYTAALFKDPAKAAKAGVTPASLLQGYDVVRLPDYLSYFRGSGGMADYSNHNFVTQDTNFHDTVRNCDRFDYAEPSLAGAIATTEAKQEEVKNGGTTTTKLVDITTYRKPIFDIYKGQSDSDRILTHQSFLDYELKQIGFDEIYSLNDEAYVDRAQLLMPRAVGYAGGLLSHFFRGRITATWIQGGSNLQWTLMLKNASTEKVSAATLKVYARLKKSTDILVPAFEQTDVEIDAGQTIAIPVTLALAFGPDESFLSFERRIVVTGTLGSEENAIMALIQPAGTGTLLALRLMVPPTPAEIVRLQIGGDGTLEKVATLSPDDPWAFLGTGPWATLSQDGKKAAKRITGSSPHKIKIYNVETGATSEIPILIGDLPVRLNGVIAWNGDDTRLAVYGSMCTESTCETSKTKHGIITCDVGGGNLNFIEFTQLTKALVEKVSFSNASRWSKDGRFFFIKVAAVGIPHFARFDLSSAQLEFGGGPLDISGSYDVSADGNTIYEVRGSPATIAAYSWPADTWSLLTSTAPDLPIVSHSSVQESPDGTRLVYQRGRTKCPGLFRYQFWVYEFATGEDRSTSTEQCSGLSDPGIFGDVRWENEK